MREGAKPEEEECPDPVQPKRTQSSVLEQLQLHAEAETT